MILFSVAQIMLEYDEGLEDVLKALEGHYTQLQLQITRVGKQSRLNAIYIQWNLSLYCIHAIFFGTITWGFAAIYHDFESLLGI